MTKLHFGVLGIEPEPYAASPILTVRLGIEELSGTVVHAIALRCQVRIEPQKRPYSDSEALGLLDLFGHRDRWSNTLRPFLWTQCTSLVQGFTAATEADLPLPCTYDFEVSASKYLHSLEGGAVPLELLFSGTIFTRGESGFQVEQVPWSAAAGYEMPVAVWRSVMDLHFPNSTWIRLGHDTFTALHRFKSSEGLLHWDDTLERLLQAASENVTKASP
ncbi:DUF6084 family protein [Jatrophihabitans sp. DSM 45814]